MGTLGDVNCDAATNVIDGLFVLQYDVGLRAASNQCPPPSGTLYTPVCDVNRDGGCNVIDGLFILQCDVGIHNAFCPASALGMRPDQGTKEGFGVAAVQVTTLHVGSGEVAPGGSIAVPVTADLDGDLLGAGTIEIRYDPAVLDATGCSVDPEGRFDYKYCNVNFDNDGVNPDSVRLNLTSLAGVTGQLTLASVTFQAVGPAGSASNLDVVPVVLADPDGAALTVSDNYGQVCVTPCGPPIPIATATATVAPSSPTTITLPNTLGQVELPAGLVTANTTFTYSQTISPTETTGSFALAGRSFTLEATDVNGQPVTTFNSRYTLTLNYSDADWQAAGIPAEANLNLYYWNGSAWVAVLPCAGCSLDTVNNQIIAVLDHLTEFALLGNPLATPAVSAAKVSNGIELTWLQVGNNVTGYEVYRSASPHFTPDASNKLGNALAPGGGNQAIYTDETITDPLAAYFYVVRAVGDGGALSPASNRVGAFRFSLTPGAQ